MSLETAIAELTAELKLHRTGKAAPQTVATAAAAAPARPRGRPAGTNSAAAPAAKKTIAPKAVADAIVKLADDHGRDAAVELLGRYGVKKVVELTPDQYEAVLADAQSYGAEGDPEGGAAADLL